MSYQSIFSSTGAFKGSSATTNFADDFVPGQYAKVNAQIAKRDKADQQQKVKIIAPKLPEPKARAGYTTPAKGLFNKIDTYGRALVTSPGTTISRVATGQGVQRVDQGAIVSARMPFKQSEAIRSNLKAGKNTNLDHVVSLELGGTNQQKNLRVEPAAQNAFDAANVEDYLGTALKDNLIDAKTADKLITQYKQKKITPQQIYNQVKPAQKKPEPGLFQKLVKGAAKGVKDVGSAVTSPVEGLAKDTNKEVIQPLASETKKLGTLAKTPTKLVSEVIHGAPEINNQKKALQQNVKAGKISNTTKKLLGNEVTDANVQRVKEVNQLAAKGASDKQLQQYIQAKHKQDNETANRITGEILGTGSLFVGGGAAKDIVTKGAEEAVDAVKGTLAKKATDFVKDTSNLGKASAAGNVGNTLQKNPNASDEDLVKSAAEGYVAGKAGEVALGTAGKLVGKSIKKIPFLSNLTKRVADTAEEPTATPDKIISEPKTPEPIVTPEPTKTATITPEEHQIESENLSQHYDEEVAAIKDKPTLLRQTERERIDEQYQHAQNALDEAAAKPQVTFPDRLPVKPTKAVPIPDEDVALLKQKVTDIKNDNTNYDDAGNLTPEAGKQINVINKQLNSAGERIPQAEKPVTVTPTEEPAVKSPEVGQSKLAASTEQKAIDKKLTQGFEGKPEYAKVNVKDQAKQAVELLKSDPDRSKRIALGNELPPEGLLPESVYTAVENHALKTGDADTLRSLATESSLSSEATGMGQRIRLLGERDPDSAVVKMRQLAETRKQAFEKQSKSTLAKAVTKTSREIKSAIPSVKRQDWGSFVESLRC